MNKWFNFYLENPFKTYNKIKKYFKPMIPRFEIGFRKSNKAKILEVRSYDLMWKDKFNSPRHEYDPRILITLFNYLHIYVFFEIENSFNSMVYWESALYWLYYDRSLFSALNEAIGWLYYNKETKKEEPIYCRILKEPWQSLYDYKKLPEIYYENKR